MRHPVTKLREAIRGRLTQPSSGTLVKVENDILPFHKNGPLDANYEKTSNCGDCMPARVIPNRPRNFATASVRAQKIVSVTNVTIHSAPTEICAYADKGEEIKQRQGATQGQD